MAYLSRTFWQDPTKRVQQAAAPGMPSADAGAGAGAQVGSAATGAPQQAAGGEPGALRSFFEQNKAQGAGILSGLADRLNQRIGTASQGMTAPDVPGEFNEPEPQFHGDGRGLGDMLVAKPMHDAWAQRKAEYEQKTQPAIDAGKENAAKNTAAIQPIGQDVQQLGQGQEGIQTLLARQAGATPYSGGQSRLDSWLAGSASQRDPGAIQGAQAGYQALQGKASNTGNVQPYKAPRLNAWLGSYY